MTKKRSSKEDSKETFLKAMEKSFGNISVSANAAGISRTIVYMWMEDDPGFKEKVNDKEHYKQLRLDALDVKLNKVGLIDEHPTVLIFLAKTIGKERGYIERTEITGADGAPFAPIQIEIINKAEQVKEDDPGS